MTETALFKDRWNVDSARALALQIHGVLPSFDVDRFVADATAGLEALEMKDRVKRFAAELRRGIGGTVPEVFGILRQSLPGALPDCEATADGWLQWPVGQLVADHALDGCPAGETQLDAAFDLMVELTQRFTSEFAVRPYLVHDQDRVLERMAALVDHPSPHVRRWCSEGSRPRLPWGARIERLVQDPSPTLPILEALRDDPEEYVRRSVANHLNDIAKDHPDVVVGVAIRWLKRASKDRGRLVRHALRTLIKAGHPGALRALGFGPPEGVTATLAVEPGAASIGNKVQLIAHLAATSRTSAILDFIVHYVKKSGETSPKVFKWTTRTLAAGESIKLEKALDLTPRSTRRLYPGTHRVELQINGVVLAQAAFDLAGGLPGD